MSLVDCTFENNTNILLSFPTDNAAAVITADAVAGGDDVIVDVDAQVRLEGCTFSSNSPSTLPILVADNRETDTAKGVFYGDFTSPSVCTYEGPVDSFPPPQCEVSKPKALAQGSGFLTASNVWLLAVQKVWPPLLLRPLCELACHVL